MARFAISYSPLYGLRPSTSTSLQAISQSSNHYGAPVDKPPKNRNLFKVWPYTVSKNGVFDVLSGHSDHTVQVKETI